MIRVDSFGSKVPAAVRERGVERQASLARGEWAVFARVDVRDNDGRVVIPAGRSLSDADIQGMDWLAEGVVGRLTR